MPKIERFGALLPVGLLPVLVDEMTVSVSSSFVVSVVIDDEVVVVVVVDEVGFSFVTDDNFCGVDIEL